MDREVDIDRLKKSEERCRHLIENIPDVSWTTAENGKTIFISPNVEKVYGFTDREIYRSGDKLWLKRIHPDDVEGVKKAFANFFSKGERYDIEYRIKRKDGEWIWLHDRSTGVYEHDGKRFADGIFSDITEGKLAEDELKREKKFTDDAINAQIDTFFVFDAKTGKALRWNKNFEKVSGYSGDEISRMKAPGSYYSKEDMKKAEVGLKNLFETGRATVEISLITKDKKKVPFEYKISLIKSKERDIVISIGRDVTRRKKAEEDLRASEEKFKVLSESSPMGTFYTDAEGRVSYVNPVWRNITGLTLEESLNFKWADALHPDDKPRVIKEWVICLKKGIGCDVEFRFVSKDEEVKWVHTTTSPVKSKEGVVIGHVGANEDITERKKAEEEVKRLNKELKQRAEVSEERYKTLYESSADAIMILEPPTWKFTAGNPAAINMFGAKDEKQFITFGPWDISPEYQMDKKASRVKAKAMIMKAMKEGSNFFRWTHKKLGGGDFPATVLLTRMKLDGKDVLQATVRDITEIERKGEELQRANEELKELDVAKTDFMNMISHELKTPLTAIGAHVEILGDVKADLVKKGVDMKQCEVSFGAIKRNNNQLLFLIDNLLEISRMQSKTLELNPESVDLRSMVLEVLDNFGVAASQKRLKLYLKVGKGLSLVVDKNRLREILNNLVSNAIKFSEAGRVSVNVRKSGGFVVIDVVDNGIGIGKDDIPHLFEKFFQVKSGLKRRTGEGTGLGLTIVKMLAELHGGSVGVKSILGKGSVFTVKLPLKGPVKKLVKKVTKNMRVAPKVLHSKNVTKVNFLKGGVK
jgi:PAS domain S-box-containing protein